MNTDNKFYIVTLIVVGTFSIVNFAYADTLDAYPGNTFDRSLYATCGYGCPINVWASASGNAGSWVYPSTISFGDVYDKVTQGYQLSIPKNTQPGTYTLYWDYECTASGGGECTMKDYQITINVKSWDTYCKGKFGSNYNYDASTHKCVKKQKITTQKDNSKTSVRTLDGTWKGTFWEKLTMGKTTCNYTNPVAIILSQNGNYLTGTLTTYTGTVSGDASCVNHTTETVAIHFTTFASGYSGDVSGIPLEGSFTTDLMNGHGSANINGALMSFNFKVTKQ